MSASANFREAFASLSWAAPLLDDPNWTVIPRQRSLKPRDPNTAYDGFCDVTLQGADRIQQWAELSQKPAPGSKAVTKALSLFKFGNGLSGYHSICHGGAVMSMVDGALGNLMWAVAREASGLDLESWFENYEEAMKSGGSWKVLLKDYFVTARVTFSFLRPVPSPGVVGVECTVVEETKNKMKIDAVMKDAKGTPLVKADSLWVRFGKGKL